MFLTRTISEIIATAIVALFAMTIHEFAHNYIAYRMGDNTPLENGKLTLNPLVHIYWPGFLMWTFIGFGILGLAAINPRRMRNPRLGQLLAVAAGPISNLLFAVVLAIPFKLNLLQPDLSFGVRQIFPNINQIFTMGVYLNIILFLFNLLPIFPLDGWTILINLVPPEVGYKLEQQRQTVQLIFFGLLALSFVGINIFGSIINPPASFLLRLLLS